MKHPMLVRLVGGITLAALLAGAAATVGAPAAQAAAAPKTITVQVVPQLPGVAFTVNGVHAVTGPTGSATVTVTDLSGASSNVVLPSQQPTPTTRVSLDRVATSHNHGVSARNLIVELDESSAVTITMLTPQRKVLPLDQVTSVTLNDSLGGTTTIGTSQLRKQPVWLPSSRPHKSTNQVTDRQVSYTVKSVMIRGTNVVNSGELRFTADNALPLTIPLILHSLTIDANDLLAGKPAGSAVQLTYPNGTTQTTSLGPKHRVTIPDLPRGTYRVKVEGGIVPLASTVHLSRDQTATELVVTTGDFAEILAIMLVAVAIVVAAGIIGRRRRHRRDEGERTEPGGEPPDEFFSEPARTGEVVDAVPVS
ncbi:MAG TPA: hypothetical protein VIC86_08820 [Acidimicrobiales bacterium]|jgi:hypothetical protein